MNRNYKQTVNLEWNVDSNWKYTFLDKNREQLGKVLNGIAHKRRIRELKIECYILIIRCLISF